MRWTIRVKLTALVLAVLLPLVAGAGLKFWNDLSGERANAQREMHELARYLARHFDEVLSGQFEILEAMASVRRLDRIEDENLATLAARVRVQHPFVHRFVASTPTGVITASSGSRAVEAPAAFANPEVLGAVLRERKPAVGPPHPSPTDGRLIVPLVAPILDRRGAPLGVVAAEIDLNRFSAFLDGLPVAPGITASIVTGDGVALARSGGLLKSLGGPFSSAPAAQALVRRRGGIAEWRGDDGVISLGGAASMSEAPWVVVTSMPRALAYAPAAARLWGSLLGLGLVTLAAVFGAWLISRRMNRSVHALMGGVRGLAAGDGPPIVVPTHDELSELADQFNRAMHERRLAQAGVEARQRRLKALAEVNLSLSRQLDLERLLGQITQTLVQLTGAFVVVLWEAQPAAGRLVRRTYTADPSIASVELPSMLTLEQGGTGWIARHRQPLFIEDITADSRMMAVDWALRHDLIAFAGVPVAAGDELLGVLTLNLKRGTLPQVDDRALLSSFASQAAVAIRNAQLFAETEARRREAETLGELGHALAQALDPDVVGRRIADGLCGLLKARNSGLYRLVPGSGDFVAMAVSGDVGPLSKDSMVFPEGTGVVGLALRERLPVTTPNILEDPRVRLTPEHRERIGQAPYRSVLAVPLVVKGRVIGALAVGDHAGRLFGADEIRLAQAFADQAALALDNARLYEETRQRLRHLDSLREVVEQILVPFSLEERLDLIARKAAELFEADRATIALWDDARQSLVVRAGHQLAQGELGRLLPPGTGALGVSVAERRGVLVNDYPAWSHRDPYIVGAYPGHAAQASIACPLLIRDQVIGALAVGLHKPEGRFTAADLDRLATLAAPAALAIEHSRLYEELGARLSELQETQAQLLQAGKLSAVGQLVSGVAHELNNPLSVVIGYGQLLMGRELPPEIRRPLEVIVAQGDRMAKIVQSLLLFSRQRKPERGAVTLRDVIGQTVGLRASQLLLSGIHVETTYGEGLPPVEGDGHQLQQVFLNLLLNAEQAILGTGPGGSGAGEHRVGDTIRIRTLARREAEQTWVVAEVGDNGPGIPPAILPRIFEPFFTTKRVGAGTGLGLSVSYGIIQQHGGRLSAWSRPGETVFTLELPAMAGAALRADKGAGEPAVAGNGRHALVVDDEPSVVDLVTTLLRQRGWEVDVAPGGRSALERLREARYDLIVSDIRMPDGSGEEFYRAATAARGELKGRFLFITGDTANPEAWRFLEEIRAPVIEKPFTTQALLQAVARLTA